MKEFRDEDLRCDTEKTCTYENVAADFGFVEGHLWAWGSHNAEIAVELELSKDQTKKIYEFMKRYYETGFGAE